MNTKSDAAEGLAHTVQEEIDQYVSALTAALVQLKSKKKPKAEVTSLIAEAESLINEVTVKGFVGKLTAEALCGVSDNAQALLERCATETRSG